MKIFDKEFDVALLSFEREEGNTHVSYTTGGEVYSYNYSSSPSMAVCEVLKKNKITRKWEQVYSSFKHIPQGSYYQEIGRQLAVECRNQQSK